MRFASTSGRSKRIDGKRDHTVLMFVIGIETLLSEIDKLVLMRSKGMNSLQYLSNVQKLLTIVKVSG